MKNKTNKTKKQIVLDRHVTYKLDYEGTINGLIEYLEIKKENAKEDGFNVEVEYENFDDDNFACYLCYYREETDEELKKRIEKEENFKISLAQRELRELKRLQEKYKDN